MVGRAEHDGVQVGGDRARASVIDADGDRSSRLRLSVGAYRRAVCRSL